MLIEIGHVEAIFRYPVKSMAGERLEAHRAAVDGDEQPRAALAKRLNRFDIRPIALGDAVGDVDARL